MSLSQALATAVSGMRVNQAGLSIVAANVANAETPGWVRKTATQVPIVAGAAGTGVRIAAINRELDQYIQRQMRVESSGASYAGLRAEFFDRLQSIYGQPGAASTLETAYNEFMSSLQVLTTNPEMASARTGVINAAKVLALRAGRFAVSIDDVKSIALPVLRHRIILNFEGEAEGIDADRLLTEVLEAVEASSREGKEVFLR